MEAAVATIRRLAGKNWGVGPGSPRPH
jgi:hypothetical protein